MIQCTGGTAPDLIRTRCSRTRSNVAKVGLGDAVHIGNTAPSATGHMGIRILNPLLEYCRVTVCPDMNR